jgi:hypothetical protein
MVQVCLDPKLSRYINLGDELQTYLQAKYESQYGPGIDFEIMVGVHLARL